MQQPRNNGNQSFVLPRTQAGPGDSIQKDRELSKDEAILAKFNNPERVHDFPYDVLPNNFNSKKMKDEHVLSTEKIYWLVDKPHFVDGKPSTTTTPTLDMTNAEMVRERKRYFNDEVISELQSIARRRFGSAMAGRAKLLELKCETYDESTGTRLIEGYASNFSQIPHLFKSKSMQDVFYRSPIEYFKIEYIVIVETSFDKSWKSMSIFEFLSGYPYFKKPERLWNYPFSTVSSFQRITFLSNLIDCDLCLFVR